MFFSLDGEELDRNKTDSIIGIEAEKNQILADIKERKGAIEFFKHLMWVPILFLLINVILIIVAS